MRAAPLRHSGAHLPSAYQRRLLRPPIAQWLEHWLASVQQELATRSYERYAVIVRQHLIPALGNLPIAKLAPANIQAFYNQLAVDGRKDGQPGALAPRSRRQIHRVLSAALSRAIEQQVLPRNPADVFKRRLPKVEPKEMTVLTAEQSAMLLHHARDTALYWPILIALATGMRRGEILALRWKNVDLDTGNVRVMESLEQTRGELRFKPPKSGRSRVVKLPDSAINELRRRKSEQAEALLKLGTRQNGQTLICARADAAPTTPLGMSNAFFKFIEKLVSSLPRIRFHDLRHTHATQLLLAGVHPRIAQERLGHSTVALTLDLYSHVTATMQEDAAAKIETAFGAAFRTVR